MLWPFCPFLVSYNLQGCKTDPEVQVYLRLQEAEGQNCHRGVCPCPLPPWELQWDAAWLRRPRLFTCAGVLFGCAGCWSAVGHRSMSGAARSVSVHNTSAPMLGVALQQAEQAAARAAVCVPSLPNLSHVGSVVQS